LALAQVLGPREQLPPLLFCLLLALGLDLPCIPLAHHLFLLALELDRHCLLALGIALSVLRIGACLLWRRRVLTVCRHVVDEDGEVCSGQSGVRESKAAAFSARCGEWG
jgi:hypothetical protein